LELLHGENPGFNWLDWTMTMFMHCYLPEGAVLENLVVIKAIGNNEERKRNHSMETQDFNVENPL
jgi:hypothetical protein